MLTYYRVIVGYRDDNTLELKATGDGGVNEMVQFIKVSYIYSVVAALFIILQEDECQYCLVRVPDRSKSTIQETTRDIFIQWIGPKVSVIKRGKKASHLGRVQEVLQPYHAAISATNKANFNENNVMNKSMPLSGSHVID